MKNSLGLVSTFIAVLAFFSQMGIAAAAEVKVLCAGGFRPAMADLGPQFESATGHKLALSFANLGVGLKRLRGGEAADLVILPAQGIDALVKEDKAAAGDVSPLARVGISVAVRKGTPKPDVSSPEAFKRTLLAAKSITYLDPAGGAPSGIHVAKMLDRLGIANEMKPKTVLVRNHTEMTPLIANGKAELAVTQLPTLMTVGGVDIVGPLPGDLQRTVVFTAVVMNSAKDAGTAKAFVNFLRTPEAVKVLKAKGMEPG